MKGGEAANPNHSCPLNGSGPRARGAPLPTRLAPKTDRNTLTMNTLNSKDCNKFKQAREAKWNRSVPKDRRNQGDANQRLKTNAYIRAGTLNLQGAWDTGQAGTDGGKLNEITRLMDDLKIDVLALQETKRPYNDVLRSNGYIFVFASTIVKATSMKAGDEGYQYRHNKGRKRKQRTIKNKCKGNGKGKTKSHGKGKRKTERDNNTEWHGVGFAYNEELDKCREFYKQVSSRHIELQFAAGRGPIKFTNDYAPQSSRPPNERI